MAYPDGVRDIDGRGTGPNGSLKNLAEKIPVASRSIFCGKLDIVRKALGIFYGF